MVYVLHVISEYVGCIMISWQEHFITDIPLSYHLPACLHTHIYTHRFFRSHPLYFNTNIYADTCTGARTSTRFLLSHVQLTICFPTLTCSDLWLLCKQAYHPNPKYRKEQLVLFRNNDSSLFGTEIKSCLSAPQETEWHRWFLTIIHGVSSEQLLW